MTRNGKPGASQTRTALRGPERGLSVSSFAAQTNLAGYFPLTAKIRVPAVCVAMLVCWQADVSVPEAVQL